MGCKAIIYTLPELYADNPLDTNCLKLHIRQSANLPFQRESTQQG